MSNYFELFSLPQQFDIDLNQLLTNYLKLQNEYHPDNLIQKQSTVQRESKQHSALINDAYQQLKDPLLRAQHLLLLEQIDPLADLTVQDNDFFIQQMQWHEELSVIDQLSDLLLKEEQLQEIQQEVIQRQKVLLIELADSLDQKSWNEATIQLRRLLFIRKFINELDKVEDELLNL